MPTPHAEAALRAMTLALGAAQPVLLSGPSGCGKTALLCELARRLGRGASMVKVHLDEQLDSKVLLGSYICSEAAGEFQWQPGVVTQAVAQVRSEQCVLSLSQPLRLRLSLRLPKPTPKPKPKTKPKPAPTLP